MARALTRRSMTGRQCVSDQHILKDAREVIRARRTRLPLFDCFKARAKGRPIESRQYLNIDKLRAITTKRLNQIDNACLR